jgi:hypothetical protein
MNKTAVAIRREMKEGDLLVSKKFAFSNGSTLWRYAAGKLALYLKKQGKSSLLVATDVYRPAAIDQLKKLGEQIEAGLYKLEFS